MRRKTVSQGLPPNMIRRVRKLKSGKTWESYYYTGRNADGKPVEIPLGKDINAARRKWAELECMKIPADTTLMRLIFDRYELEVVPGKAPATQKENLRQLGILRKIFDGAPIDAITPQIVAQYRDQRGRQAATGANRELALLSHVWNMAREWGYTAGENPVRGVRRNKERPRDFYADDAVWDAVYGHASPELRDAMDLAYLTGQRPADVMKMRWADIQDGALEVRQNKTARYLRILLDGEDGRRTELGQLLDRIRGRERKIRSMYLVATPEGVPLNRGTLRLRFTLARQKAADALVEQGKEALAQRVLGFQFRDIRPKAASETDLNHASKLLGHTDRQITQTVYRRVGETVLPTR